jgi:hypothetical protein
MDHNAFLYNTNPITTLDSQHVKWTAYSHATDRQTDRQAGRQAGFLTATLNSTANFHIRSCFGILRDFPFCMKLNDSLPSLLEPTNDTHSELI